MFSLETLWDIGQIILIDLIFAGDNAIVIAMVAAQFTPEFRKKVILYGVGIAVVLRIIFALLTVELLKISGIKIIGGALLLWICWRLFMDLREQAPMPVEQDGTVDPNAQNPSLLSAMIKIIIADISMSLDNVIAVAAVADGHAMVLVFGLAFSVVLMIFASTYIANLLQKHRWIGYIGLAIIFYVAIDMIVSGAGFTLNPFS